MTKRALLIFTILLLSISFLNAQFFFEFEPSPEHPFGLPNPDAPPQILDYAPLIGESTCSSITRKANQEWADPVDMIWRFKYILNGKGVQDETLKADGGNSGSIRQYIADSSRWYVHYYSSAAPSTRLSAWESKKNEDGKLILYNEQKAPNGMEGFYKINFYDIDEKGFKWLGEWVSKDESFSFPTWKIECTKTSFSTNDKERQKILSNIKAFSKAYMDADYETIANAYSLDGKIFPNNTAIIEGKEAIKKRWTITNGSKILLHKITPSEIKFLGDYAYDYGYYEGKTQMADQSISEWKGKYVIIWEKVNGDWKMYLDIWNNVKLP